MTREVNISLRGFLDDLPVEVAELLVVSRRRVSEVESQLNEVIERLENNQDVTHCIVDLDAARKHLYKVDNRLGDCSSILAGYVNHMKVPPPSKDADAGE